MPNRIYDYVALEREFVTAVPDISIRELCRRHHIEEPSSVHTQARKPDAAGKTWYDKRDDYKQAQHEATVEKVADRRAGLAAKLVDLDEKAITAIDLALTQLILNMANGTVVVQPKELAGLIDRVNILFNRPTQITEGRSLGLNLTAEATPEQLARVLELTRGVAGRDVGGATAGTTLPRSEGDRAS